MALFLTLGIDSTSSLIATWYFFCLILTAAPAILSDVFDEMTGYDRHSLAIKCHPDELYTRLFSKQQNREAILKAILIIRTSVIDGMIPIFKSLFKLKKKKKYADLMKILTFENMLKLDSELKKIKQGRGGGLTRKRRSNKNKHKS